MTDYGIAVDIGTSGIRCQALDLADGSTVATAITQRHPIPGMNVIDHVSFALKAGEDVASGLIIGCINNLFAELGIPLKDVHKVAVCGNTFQLSLFMNIEIRDLAYAGKNALKGLGVVSPERNGDVVPAAEVGLKGLADDATVTVPPAVRHEIGADAIAMLLMTGVLDTGEPALVVDYGTNAEMALICGDGRIITGSAAAGPAIEGQEIEKGMLAAPGAISDIDITDKGWLCTVLDGGMKDIPSDTTDPDTGKVVASEKDGVRAVGITGTGTVAALYCGMKSGIIETPEIKTHDGMLHLQDGITIKSADIDEAGKAIGAMRAGFLTLLHEAGMWTDDIKTAYMSGASGLYVDAFKALKIGMVTPGARHIVQFGNTSIELARQIIQGKITLDELRAFAKKLRAEHCMFATSETFKNIYSIEYSVWCTSMPMSMYSDMLAIYNLPPLGETSDEITIERMSATDLPDTLKCPVKVVSPDTWLTGPVPGCKFCKKCVRECPEKALSMTRMDDGSVICRVSSALCGGTACRRCERVCPDSVLHLDDMVLEK